MRYCYTILLLVCVWSSVLGQSGGAGGTDRTLVNDQWDFVGVNRMLLWVSNNGGMAFDPVTVGHGLEWPRGSGRYLAFMQGLVWGGLVEGEVRIGGSTYNHGWQAGVIRDDGTADPTLPEHRIFRARRFDAAWWNAQSAAVRTQLLRDLHEWPVRHGAPWVDANANGVYDPDTTVWTQGGVTDAPQMRGDEMLWFAANDLDARRVRDLYGSSPVGMEMHTLLWASTGHPLLDNVIFREHTLINKGTNDITEMSIAVWEDADLGDPFDDFCGVDTALGLAYAYNGLREDDVYGIPPAAGTLWLQTPIEAQAGSIAHYGDGWREGYRNLPLSAFTFYIGGSSVYKDPALKQPVGANMMLNNLFGRLWNGSNHVDPVSQNYAQLSLAGDPVRGTEWIDGIVSDPGDRRFLSGSGKFTLAKGDTQKVLLASVATIDGNHLLSVRALRNAARQLQDIHRNLPPGAQPPVFASAIEYPPAHSFVVPVSGGPFPMGTTKVEALLRAPDGTEVQRALMFDDGLHSDGAAGDGVYGAVLTGAGQSTGADLFVLTTDADGEKEWFVESEVALPGPASVRVTETLLDSPKRDGKIQPGEYVRLRLRIENGTAAEMGSWHLFFNGERSLHVDRAVQRYAERIAPAGSIERVYDADDWSSYIGIDIPVDAAPGIYVIPVTLMSDQHCVWRQDLIIQIDTLPAATAHGLLAHVQGGATGSLGYTIVNPSALTDQEYRVSIEGEDFGEKSMHVENVTTGSTLYRGLSLPNRFAPYSPEIDGWQINIGTAIDEAVYESLGMRLESFQDDAGGTFSDPGRAWFTMFEGNIYCGDESYYASRLRQYELVPVRLVFDRVNGQKAMLYLRGSRPNYSFSGYYDVPLRAYDISDTAHPRQLMLGFIEQLNRPGCDSSYMPTTNEIDREILLVFTDDYSDAPDAKFFDPLLTSTLPTTVPTLDILYTVWAIRDTTAPMFEDGDTYTITPRVPLSNRDVYILAKPRLLDVTSVPTRPASIALHAIYPNPVSPGSAHSPTIRFDTPREGHARVAIYDMLGRRTATVVDQTLPEGTHTARFDARALRAGTYIIALEAEGERAARTMTIVR
jgi:hypothetical protein